MHDFHDADVRLQAGRVSHLGGTVGTVGFEGDTLVINTATHGVMRFHRTKQRR
jgi:hypothetical protein